MIQQSIKEFPILSFRLVRNPSFMPVLKKKDSGQAGKTGKGILFNHTLIEQLQFFAVKYKQVIVKARIFLRFKNFHIPNFALCK